jgi:hypothetical protein
VSPWGCSCVGPTRSAVNHCARVCVGGGEGGG